MMTLLFEPVKFIKETERNFQNFDEIKNEQSNLNLNGNEVKEFYENLLKKNEENSSNAIEKRKPDDCEKQKKLIQTRKIRKTLNRLLTVNVLFKAATEGDVNLVENCLENGLDINSQDDFNWTPLMCAAFAGLYDMVDYLLLNGAKNDLKNLKRQTASDLARSQGYFEVHNLIESTDNCRASETSSHEANVSSDRYQCCECGVESTFGNHKTSTLHLLKTSKRIEERPFFHIPGGNKGYQLMIREGWNERSGLGLDGKGRKYPIKTILKRDRLGFGTKTTYKPKVTHFAPYDVSAVTSKNRSEKLTIFERNSFKQRFKNGETKKKEWEKNYRREFY